MLKKGVSESEEQANRPKGGDDKTLRTEQGALTVEVPRDRDGTFEPLIVPKHQRHCNGFDDKILSMYARGMSAREIRAHLEQNTAYRSTDWNSSPIAARSSACVCLVGHFATGLKRNMRVMLGSRGSCA